MTVELVIVALAMLSLGGFVGWLIGGRGHGATRTNLAVALERARVGDTLHETIQRVESELVEARRLHGQLDVEHSAVRAQHALLVPMRDALSNERDIARTDCGRLSVEVAELRTKLAEQTEANARHVAEIKDMRDSLSTHFKELAQGALDAAQSKFLARADERFRQSEVTSGAKLGALLQPVHERLQRYEEIVGRHEAERRDAFGVLNGQIESMRAGTERVSSEAAKLVNALRDGPKKRGSWGELQLKNLLESCGLSQHTDFRTEVNVESDEGRLRPDAVVNIPGGRTLVIDSKVSLNAYQDSVDAVDENARTLFMSRHVASMKNHVNTLGAKSYQSRFESVDYVIMFVPGEQFVSAALEHDPTLWDHAFEKKVLIATPANLIAILRTVAAVWRQEKLAVEAKRIGELGKEMYDRLAVVAERLAQTGTSLNRTVGSFNSAMTAFNGNLTTTGKRFRDLNIEIGKRELDDIPAVEALATHLGADPPLLPSDLG